MPEFYGVPRESTRETPTMLRIIRICRKCGARIFADAPEGLCPRCVLKTALAIPPEASVAGVTDPRYRSFRGDRQRCLQDASGAKPLRGVGKNSGAALPANSDYPKHCRSLPRTLPWYSVKFWHALRDTNF